MNKILFSIIIPVYNVSEYLDRCVQSVLRQTCKDFEVILINDGSTDGSDQICKELEDQNMRIRYFSQENKGLSETRNKGITKAKGEWIIFLDSDDTIEENTLELFFKVINKNVDIDIIIANHAIRHLDAKDVKYSTTSVKPGTIMLGKDYILSEMKYNTYNPVSVRNLYRRKFLIVNDISFEPNLVHEDELFTVNVFLQAKHVYVSGIIFYNHLIRKNSITTNKKKIKNMKSINEICKKSEYIVDKLDVVGEKQLIYNHFCNLNYNMLYHVLKTGEFCDDLVDNEFLNKHSKGLKNIIRYKLLRLNPLIFYKVSTFTKMRRNRYAKINQKGIS